MTRRALIWWTLGTLALVVLGIAGFISEFEQVPTSHWEKMGTEARKNRYLAMERFIKQMHRPFEELPDPAKLESLPSGGVLILDSQRQRQLPKARAESVLRWVEQGGYLIVAAEEEDIKDAILERLGISWYDAEQDKPAMDKLLKTNPDKPKPLPKTVKVNIPGVPELALEHYDNGLTVDKLAPVWKAEVQPGRALLLHYAWGKGQITVFDCICAFNNGNIGLHDHAEILWSLISRYQPEGKIWLAARLTVPNLWEWLVDSAWMPLVSMVLLILLWLWSIMPRFGGLRLLPTPERRGLSDHLAAIGRAVWREGGLTYWLQFLRLSLRNRIATRHPHILELPAAERAAALARLSNMSIARVKQALDGQGVNSHRVFTETVRAIQQLQQRL
jgi:hypothetical protein